MTCGGPLPFLCVLLLTITRMMEKHLASKLRLEVFSLQIFSSFLWELVKQTLQVSVGARLHCAVYLLE